MKNYLRLMGLSLLVTMSSCTGEETTALPENTCFKEDAVKELPWLNALLPQLKSPIQVVSYLYKGTYYIGVVSPSITTYNEYIFNCSGTNLKTLYSNATTTNDLEAYNYENFVKTAQAISVLYEK
ncbi:MAG: hypothetical protein ACOVQ4_00990 [Flectobacillus sp.]|uniref:hypothetical protein n=1 Tax=Flectobacillus sp. TaxID=50419 RepID=UPI003B9D2B31